MKKIITLVVMLVVLVVSAQSQDNSFWSCTDFYRGQAPYQSLSITTPQIQVWLFGVNRPELDEIDLGTTIVLKGGKWYLSGYFAHFPSYKQEYLLAWLTYVDQIGNGLLVVNAAEYLPLNGGELAFYSSETTVTWPVNRKVDLGLTASLWKGESTRGWPIKFGPIVKVRLDSSTKMIVRYQPTINGSREPRLRLELSRSF